MLTLRRGRQGQAARELRRAANHGAVIMSLGRTWSVILLVFFALAVLVLYAGSAIQRAVIALAAHQIPNVPDIISIAVMAATAVAMDLTMIIAGTFIRASRAKGQPAGRGYYLVVGFVGAVEAATIILLLANSEHPTEWWQWLLVIARGILVPVCAVFLSLVVNLPATPRDVRAKLQISAGEMLMDYVDRARESGDADPAAIFDFFTLVNDEAAMSQSDWGARVQDALARIKPDAVKAELQRHITELEQRLAETLARAKEQVTAAQEAGYTRAIELATGALTSALLGHNLPEWFTEARPEFADFTLAKRPVSRGKAAGNGEISAPKSPAERMRFFLKSFGIAPAKHRGVWIASTDIPALIDDANLTESPTELAKNLGNSTREGTAYIAPLDKVMERLLAYHCVPDTIAKAWANVSQSGADSSGNSEAKGAIIDFDSRRQSQA